MAACPACAFEYDGDFRFCPNCGTELAITPTKAERKVVTSLFCDLADFTAASEDADPEDADRILDGYYRAVRAQVEGHGGVVEKFVGDAVVAIFGVPAAREDDPERAVRAALRIIEDTEGQAGLDGEPLRLRIGINTGIALVRLGVSPASGEGFVTGDSVNTAARLQSAAPVGGVAVGLPTYEATRRVFEYRELEPAELKGKSDPVRVFQAVAPLGRLGVDVGRRHEGAFVGRKAELAALTGALDRALDGRSVELVTVVGEPGLGKSRIVAELAAYVDSRPELVQWRQGRCLPYGEGISFWALGEIVKAHAGVLESDGPGAVRAKLERTLPEGEERSWLRERLLPLLGIEAGSPATREESFTAWRRFLEHVAAERPAVLVFEDIHWADEALLAFLDDLAAQAAGVPLLIVATARPELYERHPDHGAGTARVRLTPLSAAETGRLLSAILDSGSFSAELRTTVSERSGGNPLFAHELVGLLRDRELLVRTGDSWELRPGAEIPRPDSVHAVIAARLDALDGDSKAMLGDAAVLGKVFWVGALAGMGSRDPRAVADTLSDLARKSLVSPARRSSLTGESEYAFTHALIRDVAYEQLPRAARVARHVAAADWIESRLGERVEGFADVLAHHYSTALELARAAGDPAGAAALEEPSLRFLMLAGERALGLDSRAALASFQRALQLTPPGHARRPATLARFGEAALEAGRLHEAIEALETAIAGFEAAGDPRGAARESVVLGEAFVLTRGPRRLDILNRARELLEPLPPGPELVAVLTDLADAEYLHGHHAEALDYVERALALAEELRLLTPPRTLGIRAMIRTGEDDPGGFDDFREALAIVTESGDGREATTIMNNFAGALGDLEGPRASAEGYRAGIEFARARGMTSWAEFMTMNLGFRLEALGDLDGALEIAAEVAPHAEAEGNTWMLLRSRFLEAQVLTLRGEAERMSGVLGWLEERADERAHPQQTRMSLVALALLHTALGHCEVAAELLKTVAEMFQSLSPPAALVRCAISLGEIETAEAIADKTPGDGGLLARAAVAEARDELDTALYRYLKAAEIAARREEALNNAFALLGQGRVLAALGRGAEATEPLRQARGILSRGGAAPALAEVDGLLEALAART